LLDILGLADKQLAEQLASLDELNPYAVESRYPGGMPELDVDTAKSAVRLAELAYNAAHGTI
jgi:hypothetical protein